MAKEVIAKQLAISSPITAIHFLQSSHLLAGEGEYLHLFDVLTGCKQNTSKVLHGCNIHGIRSAFSNNDYVVAIFGEKCLRIINVIGSSDRYLFEMDTLTSVFNVKSWIWDAAWIYDNNKDIRTKEPILLALVTGLNAVVILEWKTLNYKVSTTVITKLSSLIDHILLWRAFSSKESLQEKKQVAEVSIKLIGHEGAIFSITFANENYLCSASDDRSIRLWQVNEDWISDPRKERKPVILSPLKTFYGHKARVWDAYLLSDYVISIGEDASCILWDLEGNMIYSFNGHIGKNIWSMAISPDGSLAATGGGDASIRLWPILNFHPLVVNQTITLPVNLDESVKTESKLLVSVFLGGTATKSCSNSKAVELENYFSGKVLSLVWAIGYTDHESVNLIATGPEGVMVWFTIVSTKDGLKTYLMKSMNLPNCKHRWVTCAQIISISSVNDLSLGSTSSNRTKRKTCFIICGDRHGTVHVYDGNDTDTSEVHHNIKEGILPINSFRNLHGDNGVTSICSSRNHVFTCGRNGMYCKFLKTERGIELIEKLKVPFKGLTWIERLITISNGNLIIIAFRSSNLVIWHVERNEVIFQMECGGGHRGWDICLIEEDGGVRGTFAYIKATKACICNFTLTKPTCKVILKESLHGREITDIYLLDWRRKPLGATTSQHSGITVTSSEDTNMTITAYNSERVICYRICLNINKVTGNEGFLRRLKVCRDHISSIRAIVGSRLQSNLDGSERGRIIILFTAGGRMLLKAWKVTLPACGDGDVALSQNYNDSDVTLISELSQNEINFRKKVKTQQDSSLESRIMALASFCIDQTIYSKFTDESIYFVAAACSDGLISSDANRYSIPFLLSGATDGKIAIWQVDTALLDQFSLSQEEVLLDPKYKPDVLKAHACGVNKINAMRDPGIQFLSPTYIVSVSIDQRLKIWYIPTDAKFCSVKRIFSSFVNVADASNLHACPIGCNEWIIGICGTGIEIFHVTIKPDEQ
ncbi:WD repeat-containing protein 6 [Trichoplax sp. H2]|nr:WD repeat-containing protein 6 [Trichoplax sp. H2]|eukprot:RDD38601.1 WD repeat-containing protein 6 [Trichoplax sp. H2]